MDGMCNTQDVSPLHENRLNVIYGKLLRFRTGGDNEGLSINSNYLRNGVVITDIDRRTMHNQIHAAYTNMLHRFSNVNNPDQFSISGRVTTEILDLFIPTNP